MSEHIVTGDNIRALLARAEAEDDQRTIALCRLALVGDSRLDRLTEQDAERLGRRRGEAWVECEEIIGRLREQAAREGRRVPIELDSTGLDA
jgi:hypothetical protein